MTLNDQHQVLESSPANVSNDSSQPDMTDMFDMASPTWDNPFPGAVDHTDIDAVVEDLAQVLGGRSEMSVSYGHLVDGPQDRVDVTYETLQSGMFLPVSIFGGSSDNASDGKADFTSPGDTVGHKTGSVAQDVARGYTPMELEQCDTTYTPALPGHACSADDSPGDDAHGACEGTANSDDDVVAPDDLEEGVDDLDYIFQTLEDGDLDGQGLTKRKLRPKDTNTKRKFTSTWIDKDDSGNYDPKGERKLRKVKRARKNAFSCRQSRAASEASDDDEGSQSGMLIDQNASDECPGTNELMVVLSFTSEEGIEAFQNQLASLVAQKATQRRSRKTRKRREAVARQQGPIVVPNDFKNKPIARCCWSCADIAGEDAAVVEAGKAFCSLATDPTQWPCLNCLADGEQCALITPSLRKLACEDCKRQRVACSYSSTRNHNGPCQQVSVPETVSCGIKHADYAHYHLVQICRTPVHRGPGQGRYYSSSRIQGCP